MTDNGIESYRIDKVNVRVMWCKYKFDIFINLYGSSSSAPCCDWRHVLTDLPTPETFWRQMFVSIRPIRTPAIHDSAHLKQTCECRTPSAIRAHTMPEHCTEHGSVSGYAVRSPLVCPLLAAHMPVDQINMSGSHRKPQFGTVLCLSAISRAQKAVRRNADTRLDGR